MFGVQIVVNEHYGVVAPNIRNVNRYPTSLRFYPRYYVLADFLGIIESTIVFIFSNAIPFLAIFRVVMVNYHSNLVIASYSDLYFEITNGSICVFIPLHERTRTHSECKALHSIISPTTPCTLAKKYGESIRFFRWFYSKNEKKY